MAEESLEDIPNVCRDCHDAGSRKTPPFSPLLRLTGGTNNVFVITFKADFTQRYRLDAKTGARSMRGVVEQ